MKVLEVAVKETFGDRCEDFDESCPCCQAWEELDRITARITELEKSLREARHIFWGKSFSSSVSEQEDWVDRVDGILYRAQNKGED